MEEKEKEDIKIIKIILLIISAIIFFIAGFILTLIIMVDKVYAAQVELDYSKFNINVINGYSNSIYSGVVNLNTNYGDNNYNVTCTGNYCTKYYSIHTNRSINTGTYTFELRFWFDYNSSYELGLSSNDFRFYWGPTQNNITNQFTPNNLSINVVSYGVGGIWDAHQEYVITGNITFSSANFFEIYIGNSNLQQTSIYITNLNIYSGDVSGMILSGLGDVVASNNANTQNIINNNNTNTQSIINNQNSNNQNIINNDNTNTQSIINNQNQNTQTINDNLKENLESCYLNSNFQYEIGGLSDNTGNPSTNDIRARTTKFSVNGGKTYSYTINEPYVVNTFFYYNNTFISRSGYLTSNTGSITIPDDANEMRVRIAYANNGVIDNTYHFNNEDIANLRLKIWSDDDCQSKLDEVNDNIKNAVEQIKGQGLTEEEKERPNNQGITDYTNSEQQLKNAMDTEAINNVNININSNSNNWIWTTISRLTIEQSEYIRLMIISILSIGVIKLIFKR